MEAVYIEDQSFDKINFTETPLETGDYDKCSFTNCDFSGTDLGGIKFLECGFVGCNLSLAKLGRTSFRDVQFKDCKMLGLGFDTCSEFGLLFEFDGCNLNHSTFYRTKLKKTLFRNAQ